MRDFFDSALKTRFLFPIDGDCLDVRDGEADADMLLVPVTVTSCAGARVTVNGTAATETEAGVYRATVRVRAGESTLSARNESDGSEQAIRVYHFPAAEKKYRISSDDNILFLADITKNKDVYTSIFDNPYLAVYKKAHDLYGAKVHLNLFYAFDRVAAECFSDERPDFDLSMMTDKFKSEWEANSDWLKLSFHSREENPPRPYKHATAEKITADYLELRREVLRFAGEKAFSSDVTTIHFGEANPACVAALYAQGIRALTGYFELDTLGCPLVAYYAPVDLTCHVGERDFWRDTEMDMTYGRIDRVTNIGPLDKIMSDIEKIVEHPHRGGFVSIMIHEQYFHPDYVNYLPDFEERVLTPAKYLFEKGYTGALVKEVIG